MTSREVDQRLDCVSSEHQALLLAIATSILRDNHEADDVVQDALLSLIENGENLREDKIRPWLIRVVKNKSMDRLRDKARLNDFISQAEFTAQNIHQPDHFVWSEEVSQDIALAMSELPAQQGLVVKQRIQGGASFVTIASQLGISEGATKAHFRRGISRLRQKLKQHLRD